MQNNQKISNQIKESYEQINIFEQSIKSVTLIRKVFRCLNCYFIPLLEIDEKNNNIAINCLQGHKNQLSLNDYMIKGFNNSLDQVKCSICKFKREPKMIYKLCEECNNIMCKECLKFHNSKNLNHHTITVRKMDIICCLHHLNFTYFCKKCNKNLCDECLNLHKHEGNQIICLKEFNFNEKEIIEIKEKIEKEKDILNDIINIFNENMINIQNKFNEIIKEKKQIIKYKNNILDSYELKNINYQVINNLKKLKFKTDFIKLEQNKDELNNIRKIFEFLNEENKKGEEKQLKLNFNKYLIIKEKELFIKEKKKINLKKVEEKRIVRKIDISINKKLLNREKELNIRIVKNSNFIIRENKKNKKEIKSQNIIVKKNNFFIKRKEKDNYIKKNSNKNNNYEIFKTENINILSDKNYIKEEKNENSHKNQSMENIFVKDDLEKLKSEILTQLNLNFENEIRRNLNLISNMQKKNSNKEEKKDNFCAQNFNDKKIIKDYNDNYKYRELEINQNKMFKNYNPKIILREKINSLDKNIEETENDNNINEYEESIKLPLSPNIKEISTGKKQMESFLFDKSEKIDIILDEMIKKNREDNPNFRESTIDEYYNKANINEMNGVKEKVKSFDKSRRRKKKYLGKLIPKEEEYFEINKTFDYGIRKRTQLEKNPKKKNSKNNIIENGKKRIYKLDYCDKNSNCQLDLNNSFEENKENINNVNTKKNKKNSNKNINQNSKIINCNGSEKINDTFIEVSFSKRKKRKIRKLKNDNLSKSFDNIQNNKLISKANINLAKSKNNHDINKSLDTEKNQKSLISVKHFSSYEQIKNMEMDNVVSSILEINSSIFCIGSFIGKIKLFNLNTFYEILRFTSHEGAINSLFLLHDNSILSASSDKTMKKISFKNNYKSYSIDFIFNGFNNILKGIELENNYNIISFSNNKKKFIYG